MNCCSWQQDKVYVHVEVCTKVKNSTKSLLYPYLLLLSSFFLLLKLIVYTCYPAVMSNPFEHYRRHLAFNLFVANIILSINHLSDDLINQKEACITIGKLSSCYLKLRGDTFYSFTAYLQQYFFLCAFSFMAIICLDLAAVAIITLQTNQSFGHTHYIRCCLIGYTVPAVTCLCTMISELSLDRCAWGKPRFGEDSCFFAGKSQGKIMFKVVAIFGSCIDE